MTHFGHLRHVSHVISNFPYQPTPYGPVTNMFITVAVGEEKECLFNPDCMINVLLAAIKKRSNIPKRGIFLTICIMWLVLACRL